MLFVLRILIVFVFLLGLEYLFLRILSKVLKRTFRSLNLEIYRKVRTVLIIFFNIYPVLLMLYAVFSGSKPFPESTLIDYLLVYPFWFFILFCVQSLLFILAVKILKLLLFPLLKKRKDHYYGIEQKIILLLMVFSIIYVPIRIVYDYYTVEIRNISYSKKDLNPALENFRLVFISDTQADRYTNFKRLGNYISLVNKQNPDLVLIGGDVITSGPDYIDTAANFLGKIKAKYGVYTCLGDHDHWAYRDDIKRSINEVTAALASKNVPMINDKNIDLNINGADIKITFITNTYVERTPYNVLNQLILNDKKDFKILLTHQPGRNFIDLAAARNYDLLLAGHTHGGQITFLFPFINLTPTMFETRFIKGDFYFGKMLMVITRGLGMSLVPFRLNSTPEITVITLSSYK